MRKTFRRCLHIHRAKKNVLRLQKKRWNNNKLLLINPRFLHHSATSSSELFLVSLFTLSRRPTASAPTSGGSTTTLNIQVRPPSVAQSTKVNLQLICKTISWTQMRVQVILPSFSVYSREPSGCLLMPTNGAGDPLLSRPTGVHFQTGGTSLLVHTMALVRFVWVSSPLAAAPPEVAWHPIPKNCSKFPTSGSGLRRRYRFDVVEPVEYVTQHSKSASFWSASERRGTLSKLFNRFWKLLLNRALIRQLVISTQRNTLICES